MDPCTSKADCTPEHETASDMDPDYIPPAKSSDGGFSEVEVEDDPSSKSTQKQNNAKALMDLFKKKKNTKAQDKRTRTSKSSTSDNTTMEMDTLEKAQSSSILDGKYFKIVYKTNENVEAVCQLCLPQLKPIRGQISSSSNFVKHLKRIHPDKLKEYENYKISKKNSRFSKRPALENDNQDALDSKQPKLIQPTLLSLSKSNIKPSVSQNVFEERITNFVINTMSAISIIEHSSFQELFKGFNLKVPSRKTIMKRLSESHELNMQHIKDKIKTINFICSTADIWSNKKRSFLGITIHWIDENFVRMSAAIACKRFKGTHSYRNIAEVLEDINLKFGLTESKLVGTVTDNGSNFVKAFKEYGQKADEDEEGDEDNEQMFNIVNLDDDKNLNRNESTEHTNFSDSDTFRLPKHIKCASHTLNLIGTTDYRNIVRKNSVLGTRDMNAFHKCNLLWKKSNRPKSSEVIYKILGHGLSTPGLTRWNSTYDAVSQILQDKDKLPVLYEKLGLECFRETELLYLEEYSLVMKPLADTLDLLQGENNTFYGYLLPSLLSLINKYEKLLVQSKLKYGGEHLGNMCITSLKRRFSDILNLNCDEALIAAVLLPQFKLRWYNVIKNPSKSIEEIKKMIVSAAKDLLASTLSDDSDDGPDKSLDEFFDFSEEQPNEVNISNSVQPENSFTKTSKIELELLRYLEDKRATLQMLNEYPILKQLAIQFNTLLPSSGPVERLFSFATMLDDPRRNKLSDENFEILVINKANHKK